jgi:3-methylfumaryl-CoA hydratase
LLRAAGSRKVAFPHHHGLDVSTLTTSASDDWQRWVGRSERHTDMLTPAAAAALAATLDHEAAIPLAGTEPPPLAHWLLFRPLTRQSLLDADGHSPRGAFLPPVLLPRRMWAGGRLQFHHPLHIGEELSRVSSIAAIDSKTGRAGTLVFVTVRHEISNHRGLALTEEQDIVFREPPSGSSAATTAPVLPEAPAEFERSVLPDAILLFRYSALTFNPHRIHYDLPYATGVEGYPGLVVHGPLIATLLLDLLQRQQQPARVRSFTFRAQRPLFSGRPFAVCGRWENDRRSAVLWARDHDGHLTMQARAELE